MIYVFALSCSKLYFSSAACWSIINKSLDKLSYNNAIINPLLNYPITYKWMKFYLVNILSKSFIYIFILASLSSIIFVVFPIYFKSSYQPYVSFIFISTFSYFFVFLFFNYSNESINSISSASRSITSSKILSVFIWSFVNFTFLRISSFYWLSYCNS